MNKDVLDLLELREVEVPDSIRELILNCTHLPDIRVCFQLAANAATVDDLYIQTDGSSVHSP